MAFLHRRWHACICFAVLSIAIAASSQEYQSAYDSYVKQDYANSRKALENISGELSGEENYLLALHFISGLGGKTKPRRGIDLMRRAAEQNNPSAQYYLAKTFFVDHLQYISAETASAYLQVAAASNDDAKKLSESLLPDPSAGGSSVATVFSKPEPAVEATLASPLIHPADTNQSDVGGTSAASPAATQHTAAEVDPLTWIVLGGGIATAIWLWWYFARVKCPSCGKRGTSRIISRRSLGVHQEQRLKTVHETTKKYVGTTREVAGTAETIRKVPITVSVERFENT